MKRGRLTLKPPGKLERLRAQRKALRTAREEGRDPAPFVRKDQITGERQVGPGVYQHVVSSLLARWIDAFAAGAIPLLTALRGRYHEQVKVVEPIRRRLQEVMTRVHDPLKLGGDHGTLAIIALFLAGAVNLALTYGVIEQFGWPFAVTLTASVALVAIEVAVTALVGRGIAALALDKPGTPFDLESRERVQVIAQTTVLGIVALAFVVALGLARESILWVLAGMIGAGLGIWLGGAFYEARFHRERDRLEDELKRERERETVLRESYIGTQQQVLETATWLHDEAALILARADAAFGVAFRHARRHAEDATPPVIPAAPLPELTTIHARLIVPLDGEQQAPDQPDQAPLEPAPVAEVGPAGPCLEQPSPEPGAPTPDTPVAAEPVPDESDAVRTAEVPFVTALR